VCHWYIPIELATAIDALPGIGIAGSPRKVLDRKTYATCGATEYICGREYVPKAKTVGYLRGEKRDQSILPA
jgi:hypothetical protein